jgi:hypothetical protein
MSHTDSLIEAYSGGAALLRDAIPLAAEIDWDARPIEGRWSIREVICHLADSEIVYADRMKRVIAEEHPTFFEADPNLFRPALFCSQRPLEGELDVVSAVRAHMLPILRSCGPREYQRTGVHSLDGTLTLQKLLERITAHIPHHVAFIEEKLRALGASA